MLGQQFVREKKMSLFFALILIGLPAAALFYDFYRGGNGTTFVPQGAARQKAITDRSD